MSSYVFNILITNFYSNLYFLPPYSLPNSLSQTLRTSLSEGEKHVSISLNTDQHVVDTPTHSLEGTRFITSSVNNTVNQQHALYKKKRKEKKRHI